MLYSENSYTGCILLSKIKIGKFKGISGMEHEAMYVNNGKETYLYNELKNPNVENIVKTLAIALDLKFKPYLVEKSGKMPTEWVNEVVKVGGKVVKHTS